VLTSERWTPYAFGTAQHTIMVQVEGHPSKAKREKPGNQALFSRFFRRVG
jgi:hypothetical protein